MATLPKSKNITGATPEFLAKPREEQIAQTSRGIDELVKNFQEFSNQKNTVDRTPAIGLLQKAEKNALITTDSQKKIQRQADQYAAQMRQARIDAINRAFAPRIQREEQEGAGRLARVDAMNFARGIIGSGAETTKIGEQKGLNEKALQALEDEKAILINEAFGYADALGKERAKQLTEEAQGQAQSNIDFYKTQAEKATKAIQLFGKTGVSFEEIEQADPNTIKTLREVSGMSDAEIKAMLASTAPEGTYQWNQAKSVGTKMYVPKIVNGKVVMDTLDLPYNADKQVMDTIKSGDNVYLVYEDGTTKLLASSGGGSRGSTLTPYQQFQATQSIAKDTQSRTENAREMARQASLIESSYKNIVDGRDRSLNTQAIVTSFNKILDPTSVVRESEYDRTAQGQSLLNRLQGKYDNIVAGGAGVTEETLKEAADIAKQYLEGARQSIIQQNQRAEQMAQYFGLNPSFVTSNYVNSSKTINDYRAEFPQASDEELQALMAEEQGL